MTHKGLKSLLLTLLTLQIAFGPAPLRAAQIKLKHRLMMRVPIENGNEMARIGELAKGSIVEIPDQFIEKKNGQPDLELSLNNWLRSGGVLHAKYSGKAATHFFPVKVIRAAKGSTMVEELEGNEIYMALKYLTRSNGAIFLEENVQVVRENKSASLFATDLTDQQDHTTLGLSVCDNCQTEPIKRFINDISNGLAAAKKAIENKTKHFEDARKKVTRNFKESCGITYDEFRDNLRAITLNDPLYFELMQSVLVNESAGAGRCRALNDNDRYGGSWGLFQINASSSSHPACKTLGKSERRLHQALKAAKTQENSQARANFEKSYGACKTHLYDVKNNTKDAYAIFKEKHKRLFGGKNPHFNISDVSIADQKRLILSAYNGGEGWVLNAKRALLRFNKINGTNLDHNKWNDLRLFFLRAYLDRGNSRENDKKYFNSNDQELLVQNKNLRLNKTLSRRARQASLTNLAYVETLVPLNTSNLRTIDGQLMAINKD